MGEKVMAADGKSKQIVANLRTCSSNRSKVNRVDELSSRRGR